MYIDGHAQQKEQVAEQESGVEEPGYVVAGIVCEVPSLQITVDRADTEGHHSRRQRCLVSSENCSIEKGPILCINILHMHINEA